MNDVATSPFSRMIDRMRATVRDLGARHALRQELLEADRSGVLDDVLADLNMSRGELDPLVHNYPLSTRLFGAMAARLGVDPTQDGPALRRAIQRTCALCANQGECEHWLESGQREGYEKFCPNTDYWNDLKARILAHAKA